MRYSLVSRFRGALLGSLVGEILGSTPATAKVRIFYPQNQNSSSTDKTISSWSKIADGSIESLIRCRRLNLEDWLEQLKQKEASLLYLKEKANSIEAAIATLPVTLFFHENPIHLKAQLEESVRMWLSHASEIFGVWVIGNAIAKALTEHLEVTTLITQILNDLEPKQTPLYQKLAQVQILLQQGANLETTLTQLRQLESNQSPEKDIANTSIALAFYCFLSHPEDFSLSVTRAIRSGYQPQITATLTGALSGVYNSVIGIPVDWRVAATQSQIGQQRWQMAEDLVAIWSGVWDLDVIKNRQLAAVAAPGVIQSS